MIRYAVFGASGCGRGVLPLVREQIKTELTKGIADLVFVDDRPQSSMINGHRILKLSDWLNESAEARFICIAVANGQVRQSLANRCSSNNLNFFNVIASNAVQLDDVNLGEGAILAPFVTLTSNINIGKHFHANLYSYVEHDCIIGDFVTFAPGVKCNGNVHIHDHVYIGAGAVIKQGLPDSPLVIGKNAIIGMGAVVTKSIPPGATVVGNPARQLVKR